MKIYIDDGFCCHITNPSGSLREFDVDFFDGKCTTVIEGYRYVPTGESWVREDGAVFLGEMIAPLKPFHVLDASQRAYEQAQLADMKAALTLLGVNADE